MNSEGAGVEQDPQTTNANVDTGRWQLARDVFVLQFKLVMDGLRDVILVPVSLVAGIMSLVKGDTSQSNDFYDLLRLGKKSERWINLFGAAEHSKTDNEAPLPVDDIDEMVTKVESFLIEEYKSGGVTRQAKDKLDDAIGRLHEKVRSSPPDV